MPLSSRELTIFLSSTVEDLRPVRNEIAATLAQRGSKVRKSDDADFPVLHGVTSHVACLQAVKNAHILITLVGYRFGGEFEPGKSITWREWETARENGVIPIVLVNKGMNDLAIKIGEKRRELEAQMGCRSLARSIRESATPTRPPSVFYRAWSSCARSCSISVQTTATT